MNRVQRAALWSYRHLARRFPEEFRDDYAASMVEMAESEVDHASRRGAPRGALRGAVLPRLIADLILRLIIEHWYDARRDARYAARMLARSKGFTAAAVLCLAIGIGLTAAMYSQIRSTVFRPLPGVEQSDALVRLQKPLPYSYFEAVRDEGGMFVSTAAYMAPVPLVVGRPGMPPQRLWGHLTTPNYFDVLGTAPALGRTFGAEERTPGAAPVVVLSDRVWRTRFGGDPSIVGQQIEVNGQSVMIIGVGPPGFLGASPTTSAADLWMPTTAPPFIAPELRDFRTRRAAAFEVIGRLKPGVTYAQTDGALDALLRRLEVLHNDPAKDSLERRARVLPGGRMFGMRDEDLPRAIGFPFVLVSLVLVMACGNVANMILARSAARQREMAIRLSLGASRSRIVRQLLTESLMLALLGAIGGVAFAFWLLSALESMRPLMPEYGYFEVHFDWQALVVAVLVAGVSSVMIGLLPALRSSRGDIYTGLKPQAASAPRGPRWASLRNVLVFQQVTISMILLLLTGFVVVGWQRSAGVDVGFNPVHLYRMSLDPVRDGYTPERAQAFFAALPERLRRVPGIRDVSVTQTLPLAMSSGDALVSAKVDFASGSSALGAMRVERVGAGFFETLGTSILRGRAFTDRDERDDARVVIVNETMASRIWPGEDPVGRTLELDEERWQIVAVASDIRSAFPLAPTMPAVYRPITPSGFATPARHGVTVLVRAAPGFDASTRLRQEIEAIDRGVHVFQVTRMTDDLMQSVYLAQVASVVYGGMGVFGLILASVGLAGVTAHAVARRTREIGIRIALGARRADVLWLVLRESGAIVLAGTVVGLVAALAVTWALASFVEALAEATRTSIADPLLLLGAPAMLGGLALAACFLPARRSTRINPVSALRSE